MGDVFEFAIPCHPFNPQIRDLLRLLDLGVITTHYDIRQKLYAYHWTYQGKLALIQLGIRHPPRPSPYSPDHYTFTEIANMNNLND